MKETIQVTKEILTNLTIMNRLAINDLNAKNKGNILGILWLWINPAIQLLIYALVFGTGLRGSAPVENINFFSWLLPGFIVWMYINSVITTASRSIVAKINIVTKIKFPVSIVPGVVILSELYMHILMLITSVVILLFLGFSVNQFWIYIIYFTFASTCLLLSVSIFNSALTTIFRDYQHIVYNIMRTMFFITPVLFPKETMKGEIMKIILWLNPFTYLLEGYRDGLVFSRKTTFMSLEWGIYFWCIVIIIYIIGCNLHVRMRRNLLDYI
jgi:ABC-type polysaccharide/polyol phosphate export systems, permease component